ncbi:MAG: protein kinase [Lentisphaerae bacterium]|nr:protein kinase [Lentisphaerota bacterium]
MSEPAGIIAERISEMSCIKCGKMLDVSHLPSFADIKCPDCATNQTVPAQFGNFLLEKKLGAGGMGELYKARDMTLGRYVAIKVMKKSMGDNPEFLESFLREAQSAAALNHRNVGQIYSFGQEQGQPYIVMELITGGRMDEMISEGQTLEEIRALEIHIQVAEGLKAAAAVGLIHGDVKPANVLFDQNDEAKVVDFGLAQFVGRQQNTGEIWGTPFYIAPEKARGKQVDFRSDIYSLGATLYHMLAGVPPFDGQTPVDVVMARLEKPPPDLLEFRPDLNPATVDLVKRMLEPDPNTRYPSYDALLEDMRQTLETVSLPPVEPGKFTQMITRIVPMETLQNRTLWWSVTGGILALALVAGGWWAWKSHKAEVARIAAEKEENANYQAAIAALQNRQEQLLAVSASAREEAQALIPFGRKADAFLSIPEAKRPMGDIREAAGSAEEMVETIRQLEEEAAEIGQAAETATSSVAARELADTMEGMLGQMNALHQSVQDLKDEAESALARAEKIRKTVQDKVAKQEAEKKAEEERLRLVEVERKQAEAAAQAAEQARVTAVQEELDRVDAARGDGGEHIAKREFREAARKLTDGVSNLKTDEARAAFKAAVDCCDSLAELKSFIIKSIREMPYTNGWTVGSHTETIKNADPRAGLVVSLGAESKMEIPWEKVTYDQFVRIAVYYIENRPIADDERADKFLAVALFCYESNKFKPVEQYVEKACRMKEGLKQEVNRLMPGFGPP